MLSHLLCWQPWEPSRCMYAYMYLNIYACMYVRKYVCMYLKMYV